MSEISFNYNNLQDIHNLNKSCSLILLKRLNNEIKRLDKNGICNKQNINITYDNEKETISITFHDNKNRLIKFIVHKSYPINPPDFFIGSKSYYDYLYFKSIESEKYFRENEYIKCHLFCDSKICSGNWKSKYALKDLIDEFREFHQMCKNISNKIIVNIIKRKYLVDDIDILVWL